MKKEDINILKLKKKTYYKKKNELKFQLLKSILKNQKIPQIYQNYAFYLLSKRKINFFKFKHICLTNNKASSVENSTYVSKYALKNLLLSNKSQNIRINS